MCEVDDDPCPIHFADDGLAERRQTPVNWGFGLYVTDLIDVVMDDRNGAHAIAKSLMHAVEPILDKVSTFYRKDRGSLVVALRGVYVGRNQAFCKLVVRDQRLEFSELSLVVRIRLTRAIFPGRMETRRRRHFEQPHVRNRGKQRGADMARVEVGDGPFLERFTERARCRRLVRQVPEKEPAGMTMRIDGSMAAEERDAGRTLLRAKFHA
jgi:hypothetical protein